MTGLIPIIGPIWANGLNGRVAAMAEEANLPVTITAQMSANIAFDFLVPPMNNYNLTDHPPSFHRRILRGTFAEKTQLIVVDA